MTAQQSISKSLDDFMRSLAQNAQSGEKSLPPVDKWNPDNCGDIGMEIRKDGSWWHEGRRIGRPNMTKLFSRILRKDADGQTYLVTPYEKVIVKVEDAHFLVIRLDCHNHGLEQSIIATTNMGDLVTISKHNPIEVKIDPVTREPRPYLLVRGRLNALILRAPFYELVEYGTAIGQEYGVYSSGTFFKLDRLD